MRVAAVVVNWNGGDENLACLRSLLDQEPPPERILFVDNASSDGSPERVAERFGARVEVLRNAENLGYGGGNNVGVELALQAGADAVLVVNNDVELPPGTLARLVAELEAQPDVGVVGPRVLLKGGTGIVWAAGGSLTWRQNLTTLLGHGAPDGAAWRASRDVDYVPGCAMLVRRAVLELAGLLDADYFAYTEDVDFGLRARAHGWRSRVVGEVAALHAPSTSTGGGYNPRRKYMMGVNSVRFLRRWAGPREWLSFALYDVLTLPLLWLVEVRRGRGRAALAKALGIFDGLRGKRITAQVVRPGSHWLW